MPDQRGAESANPLAEIARAKRAAKRLKRALAQGESAAEARFAAVFADRRPTASASHADCLHVIAREAGAESWPRLKLAAEAAASDRETRIRQLKRALEHGNFWLVDRLLGLDPSLAAADFALLLALADEASALDRLAKEPTLAVTAIYDAPPLTALCFSQIHKRDAAAPVRQIRLLDAMRAAGADLNAGRPAEPGSEHRLSPLYGALGHAGNLALAEVLLTRGADPNDNESLYHATELPEADALAALRLLFAHGAMVGTTNAFLRMLDREFADGVALFLAQGADPNAPPYRHPSGVPMDERNALHHATLRGRSGAIGAMLIEAGADPSALYQGRTPYALARVVGNDSMAAMLTARGFGSALSDVDAFLADLAAGDAASALARLAADPSLTGRLSAEDLARQTELAADAAALPALKAMLEAGFDPNAIGAVGMPPIHAAAWHGHAEIVALYLTHGAALEIENDFGGAALGTAIHGSANCPARDDGDYETVVRLLLDAGAEIRPDKGHLEMGSEAVTLMIEAARDA